MASYNIITTPYDAGRYHVNVAYEGTLNGRPVTPLERIEHLVYGIICLIPLINIIAERILFAMGKHTLEALSAREVEPRPPAPSQPIDVKDETQIPFAIEVASCLEPEYRTERYMLLKFVPNKREQKAKTINFTFCIDNSGSMRGGRLVRVIDVMHQFLDRAKSYLESDPKNMINLSVVTYDENNVITIPWRQLAKEKIEEVHQMISSIRFGRGTKIIQGLDAASKQMEAMAKAYRAATNSFVFLTDGQDDTVKKKHLIPFHQKIKKYSVNLYALGISFDHDHEVMKLVTMDTEKSDEEQLPTAQYEWVSDAKADPSELSFGQTTLPRAIESMFNYAVAQCVSNIKFKLTTTSSKMESALLTPDDKGLFSLGALFHGMESRVVFTVGDNREVKLDLTYDIEYQKYRVHRTLTIQECGNRKEVLHRVIYDELAKFYKEIDKITDCDQKLEMTDTIYKRIRFLSDVTGDKDVQDEVTGIIAAKLMPLQGRFRAGTQEDGIDSVVSRGAFSDNRLISRK